MNARTQVEEKLDASLMYGAFITWLILQVVVLPGATGGVGCMSRVCHQNRDAGKLKSNSSDKTKRPKGDFFERRLND